MNYERIYAAFIGDRRTKEPKKPDYFERHHIVPRCLGGSDDPENLIRLTPEDHYFAHLLLAHIHGGPLWACVFLLSGRKRSRKSGMIVGQRPIYGVAKRRHADHARGAEGLKGSDNGNHNPIKHGWENLDTGETRLATLHQMWSEFGGGRASWTSVVSGDKNTHLGWKLIGSNVKRGHKGKAFCFLNRDGHSFVGTQKEFCDFAGLSYASGSRVARNQSVTACGWRLSTTTDREHNHGKIDGKPSRSDAGAVYVISKQGLRHRVKRRAAAEIIGCSVSQFSAGAYLVINGKSASYKGWSIEKEVAMPEAVASGEEEH